MKQKTKARNLRSKIEDEVEEVAQLLRVLETNIVPAPGSDKFHYKVEAVKLLSMAKDALEEAASYVDALSDS